MKKENGINQLAEIKEWKELYSMRPIYYQITIQYVENEKQKQTTITTSNSCYKKYKNEENIRIVTVPGTKFIFLEKETWMKQNIELIIIIIGQTIILIPLLLLSFLEMLFDKLGIVILFFLIIYKCLRHKKDIYSPFKHKTRMKYVTNLSCEEIINKFQHGRNKSYQFEKEKTDIKDKMYMLSVHNEMPHYLRCLCEKVQYKVLITPDCSGSAVWVFLYDCSNQYTLNRFAEKVKELMKQEIAAVRVE